MKITNTWMKDHNACEEAFMEWEKRGCESNPIKVIDLAWR